MNFLPTHRRGTREKSRFRLFVLHPLVFLLAAAFLVMLFPSSLQEGAHAFARPFWGAGRFLGDTLRSARSLFISEEALSEELRRTREKNARLRLKLLEFAALEAENERLRQILGRADTQPEHLSARVLVRPPRSLYDTFVLDRGSDHGVAARDFVLVGGVVVGSIESVFAETSLAKLFSSPGVETAALLAEPPLEVGMSGMGGGTFRVKVPKGMEVREGAVAVLAGREAKPFALVERVESTPADSFQTLYLRSPVELARTSFVMIDTATPNISPAQSAAAAP